MRVLHLGDLDAIDAAGVHWLPLRRVLGATAFGTNAYRAEAGEQLIEPHDELPGTDEEMYVLIAGRATFTVAGEEVRRDAGHRCLLSPTRPNTARRWPRRTARSSWRRQPGRCRRPAAGLAAPLRRAAAGRGGDYLAAYETAAEALADHPDDADTHYELASWAAMGGQRERALDHWRRAVAANPRARAWAEGDANLDPIRDALD